MVFRAKENNPSDLIRDFKGFTSKQILKSIRGNKKESRRKWLMKMFLEAGSKNSNVEKYQFWQQNNHPIELWTNKVIQQKIDYIHNNPVKAGYVRNTVDWKYSSARNYMGDDSVLKIDV
jgi:REP element-mobilizing transposase RayT